MKQPSKKQLQNMYTAGQSMKDIALTLHCSVHKVVYWMNKYNIKRRNHSDASYIKLNPSGDPYKIKSNLTVNDTFLFGIALGLYLGEGNKAALNTIRISNTNPLILKLFLKYLLEICLYNPNKISCSIICFNDSNPEESRVYWSKQLQISPDRFGTITQIPPQGKGTYRHKSHYGVCTVQANNIKLAAWFRNEVNNLENLLLPR